MGQYASVGLTVLEQKYRISADLSSNLVRHRSLNGFPVRFRVGKGHFHKCFLPTLE